MMVDLKVLFLVLVRSLRNRVNEYSTNDSAMACLIAVSCQVFEAKHLIGEATIVPPCLNWNGDIEETKKCAQYKTNNYSFV